MKSLFKITLVSYLLFLVWLILFKTSVDFASALSDNHIRNLNLTPFTGYSSSTSKEMIDNLIVFVPFGLLLGVSLKHVGFSRKFMFVCGLSLFVETVQYIFALGVSDITDVIMNSAGGLAGLTLYALINKYTGQKLDRYIVTIIAILLVLFLITRFLILKIRV